MKTKTVCKQRESSFELMRLVSMFLIVLYHLFCSSCIHFMKMIFYKAIQIPLHIGVLLFVLISGYFGIKATPKRITETNRYDVCILPSYSACLYLFTFWGGNLKKILKTLLLFHIPILVYANLYLSFHFRANNQSVSERCTEKEFCFWLSYFS